MSGIGLLLLFAIYIVASMVKGAALARKITGEEEDGNSRRD